MNDQMRCPNDNLKVKKIDETKTIKTNAPNPIDGESEANPTQVKLCGVFTGNVTYFKADAEPDLILDFTVNSDDNTGKGFVGLVTVDP